MVGVPRKFKEINSVPSCKKGGNHCFREKCDYIKSYLDKMEVLLLKSKEDGQVTPTEFKLFQKLLKEFESKASFQAGIKSKDFKKIQKKAKKEVREQQKNMLLHETIQKLQRTMS